MKSFVGGSFAFWNNAAFCKALTDDVGKVWRLLLVWRLLGFFPLFVKTVSKRVVIFYEACKFVKKNVHVVVGIKTVEFISAGWKVFFVSAGYEPRRNAARGFVCSL